MKRKRPYILLELLIGFTLLALCCLPLVHTPLKLVEQEILVLQKMELQRQSALAFEKIKTRLHKKEISWDALPQTLKETRPCGSVETITLDLKGAGIVKLQQTCTLTLKKAAKGKEGEDFFLVLVNIVYKPEKRRPGLKKMNFIYSVFLTKDKV